jgi:hypothetical protein
MIDLRMHACAQRSAASDPCRTNCHCSCTRLVAAVHVRASSGAQALRGIFVQDVAPGGRGRAQGRSYWPPIVLAAQRAVLQPQWGLVRL